MNNTRALHQAENQAHDTTRKMSNKIIEQKAQRVILKIKALEIKAQAMIDWLERDYSMRGGQ